MNLLPYKFTSDSFMHAACSIFAISFMVGKQGSEFLILKGHSIFYPYTPYGRRNPRGMQMSKNGYGRENPNGALKIKQKILGVIKVSGEYGSKTPRGLKKYLAN